MEKDAREQKFRELPPASFDFHLPRQLECAILTEARTIPRDAIKLMVSRRSNNEVSKTIFNKIADFLKSGDALVVSTSGTLKAALAKREHLALCYWEAIKEGCQRHEFGDLHLIL